MDMRISGLYILPAGVLVAVASLLAGCSGKDEENQRRESRALYEKSVDILQRHTDSLLQAKDSARVRQLDTRLDAEMTRINYEYPPEVAPGLSESENDTLTMMTLRFVGVRDSLLRRFDGQLPIDTLAQAQTDSLAKTPKTAKPGKAAK